MTAGEDQTEAVVFQAILKAVLFIRPLLRTRLRFEMAGELVLRRIKSGPSAESIDGFEPGRRNQPGSRVVGYSILWPQAQSSREGFVHGFFGKVEITEQADQRCQDSPRIHAIKGIEQFACRHTCLLGGRLGHEDDLSKPGCPKQFGEGSVVGRRSLVVRRWSFVVGRWRDQRLPASSPPLPVSWPAASVSHGHNLNLAGCTVSVNQGEGKLS